MVLRSARLHVRTWVGRRVRHLRQLDSGRPACGASMLRLRRGNLAEPAAATLAAAASLATAALAPAAADATHTRRRGRPTHEVHARGRALTLKSVTY